ncbi:MAG: hypothetical protein AAGJ79_12465, partial [Verrucomicrobiota bacterium]
MKRLLLVINPYSGFGKCAFTQVFVEHLSRKGISHAMATSVEENAASDAEVWDLDEELNTEHLLSFLDDGPIGVIDAPVSDAEQIIEFIQESGFVDSLADVDAEMTMVLTVSDEQESVERMVRLAEDLADGAQYLAVHEMDMEESNWAGSYGEKVMNYLGAAEVEVPGIEEEILSSLEESHEMTLSQALAERKMLPRFLRDGLHRWELEFADNLEECSDILVPEDAEDRSVYVSGKGSGITR